MKGTATKINSQKGFLNFLRPLTTALPLIKNVLTALAESVLVPLGLMDTSSVTGTAIEKKDFGSGMTTLIFSNGDLNDIMKTIKSHEDSGLLIKRATEIVENEIK